MHSCVHEIQGLTVNPVLLDLQPYGYIFLWQGSVAVPV